MPSGGHRHQKRLAAPNHWGLEKSGGKFAVRMMPGPHSKELAIPLKYVIARFLKLASTSKEVTYILSSNMISVNGRDVTSPKFPVGLFDVVTIKKTNQHYRVFFSVNRKFKIHKISSDEAQYRITKVMSKHVDQKIPYVRTLDGYNFRFVDPAINIADTVKVDIKTNKIVDHLELTADKVVFVYGGSNTGRVGIVNKVETLRDGSTFLYLEDNNNKKFTVLSSKAMVIGSSMDTLWISLDEQAGVKLSELEMSNLRYHADAVEAEAE